MINYICTHFIIDNFQIDIFVLFGSMRFAIFCFTQKKKKKGKRKGKRKANGTKDLARLIYVLLTYAAAKDGKGFRCISDSALVGWQKEEKKRRMKKVHINSIIVSVVISLKHRRAQKHII